MRHRFDSAARELGSQRINRRCHDTAGIRGSQLGHDRHGNFKFTGHAAALSL
jgi:hypothetical protein